MDRAIREANHTNRALRKGLQKMMDDYNQDHTEIDLLKTVFQSENGDDENNYRRKHLRSLKENVEEIRNKTYQLPSRTSEAAEFRVMENRPSVDVSFVGVDDAQEISEPQIGIQKSPARKVLDFESPGRLYGSGEDRSRQTVRGHISARKSTPSTGVRNGSNGEGSIPRPPNSSTPSKLLDNKLDPFMDDILSPPRDNLLINKLIRQNEIIDTLNQQLRKSKEENRRMNKQISDLEASKLAVSREKEIELEHFRRDFMQKHAVQNEEPLLRRELRQLQEEIQIQKDKSRNLESAVSIKDEEITSLRSASVQLSVKLVAYRNNEKEAKQVIDGLRFTNQYLKTFIDDNVVELQKQLETLGRHILSGEDDYAAKEPYEDGTTSLLLKDNTTNMLIRNRERFSVDQFLACMHVKEASPFSFKKFALMALFAVRTRNAVRFKKEMKGKISSLS